ncbi:MAG: cytochrome c biogenesis protein CcsA [Planctomycetia bacterium]|nr:cytochrome c biogenesis protein CcsA [Planctomycetia bacterium]
MLAGISITCFAASYAVALLVELSRLMFRSRVRGALLIGFAGAGLIAQTCYLGMQAIHTPSGIVPLSSWFHWYLLSAWALAIVYLYLTFYHPQNPLGLFLLPLVLGLIGVAYLVRQQPVPLAREEALAAWLWIHVVGLLLGTVAVLVGFATGVMYLVQSWRLKHKLPASSRFQLPSLEWLQQVNARSLVVSMVLMVIGVLGGLVRNADLVRRAAAGGVPWSDPVVWTTALLVGWLIGVVVFNAVYRPSRQGRKVAYLTLASFVLLVLTLAIVLLAPSAHPAGGRKSEVGGRKEVGNALLVLPRCPNLTACPCLAPSVCHWLCQCPNGPTSEFGPNLERLQDQVSSLLVDVNASLSLLPALAKPVAHGEGRKPGDTLLALPAWSLDTSLCTLCLCGSALPSLRHPRRRAGA